MKRLAFACVSLLVFASARAFAQTTCYTSRASWTAAAGPPSATEDFSSFGADTSFEQSPVQLAIGSIQVSTGPAGFRNLIEVAPFQYNDNNGTSHASVFTEYDLPTEVRITLIAPASAVGFDVFDAFGGGGEGLHVVWYSGTSALGSCDVLAAGPQFVGVLSSQPIDSILLQSQASMAAGEGFGLDDIALAGGTPILAFCDPGVGGVIACPCANPPSGAQRGCNNSSATGGASISASGSPSISSDTLHFLTAAERPSATSVVLSGTSSQPGGLIFGQGVRCVSGLLKRLYVKTAVGGSISAPAPGDPSVSARHAALADPVVAGSQRFYMVYYRDPIVLGGCSALSTYNCTNALDLTWGN
jgi:hypothetical protein